MLLSGISPILSAVWICGGTPAGRFHARSRKPDEGRLLQVVRPRGSALRARGVCKRSWTVRIGDDQHVSRDRRTALPRIGPYCIECGWVMGYLPLVLMDDDTPGSYFLK